MPLRFRKIRQYGFLANACKRKKLELARKALGLKLRQLLTRAERKTLAIQRVFQQQPNQCPDCQQGKMIRIGFVTSNKDPPASRLGYF